MIFLNEQAPKLPIHNEGLSSTRQWGICPSRAVERSGWRARPALLPGRGQCRIYLE